MREHERLPSDAAVALSPEQQKLLNLAKKGRSLFFTGSAGTGKSVSQSHNQVTGEPGMMLTCSTTGASGTRFWSTCFRRPTANGIFRSERSFGKCAPSIRAAVLERSRCT